MSDIMVDAWMRVDVWRNCRLPVPDDAVAYER